MVWRLLYVALVSVSWDLIPLALHTAAMLTECAPSSNHYTKYRNFLDGPHKGEMRKDGKQFQEPYAYDQHYRENMHHFHDPREAFLFRAVLPVCRYYVRLRYSLMQLLYDAMFENAINGMPVARSMVG